MVRARPHLTEELSALLCGDDAPARTEALRFVGDMITPVPAGLIPSVRAALDATGPPCAHGSPRSRTCLPTPRTRIALWAADAAGNFPESAADFIHPLREMQAALARLPAGPDPHAGHTALNAWLHEHDPAHPR